MENITQNKKSNTQLLKDVQNIVDDLSKKKEEVEILLQVIDKLEAEYYKLVEEIKQNNKA